nr:hypothetical protein [Pseudomonas sp.]
MLKALCASAALALACLAGAPALAAPAQTAIEAAPSPRVFPTSPVHRPDQARWRLGYLQVGDYADYPVILSAIVRGLISLGWMQPLELPDAGSATSREIWQFLARNAQSDYLQFVDDGFYSPGNFDSSLRAPMRETLTARLRDARDIDLMIAMGTWAGQDLAREDVSVPTIVASTSDPIASGIIKSAQDSGFDHVHAKVEPNRYQRQVQLFHDIVPFTSLGVVYEDSPEGRTFAAVSAIEDVASGIGFTVKACHAPFNNVSPQQAMDGVTSCYANLAGEVDAIYLTVHRGLTSESIGDVVASLLKAQVASFSMLGSEEVRRGVLMSMAQADYLPVGQFHAEVIARIFHGASPRELSQIWLSPAEIAINLKTAELIGFDPPIDILLASDEVYDSVVTASP